jgi:hypothetical protein
MTEQAPPPFAEMRSEESARPGKRGFRLLVASMILVAGGCERGDELAPPAEPSVDSTLDAIVLPESSPPSATRFLRELDGRISGTRLVQDGGPAVQVAVQQEFIDALTREFGSEGVAAVKLDGAPTETLDPSRDVAVDSLASAYEDATGAQAALDVILETTREQLERERQLSLGDGGSRFRGRFLRGMPLVSYVWRSGRFILHVLAVGAFDEGEIRSMAKGMDERAERSP